VRILTENERKFLVEALLDTILELSEIDEISQGVEDKLISSLQILGPLQYD
jgi:hypothetical protein